MAKTSAELFTELSTTELVIIKDGLTVETDRLRSLLVSHPDSFPDLEQAYRFKVDLEYKVADIIEARLEEEKNA
jgi:hypothetical protein